MTDNVKTPVNTEAKEKGFDSEQAFDEKDINELFADWIFDLYDNGAFECVSFKRSIRSYSFFVSTCYEDGLLDEISMTIGRGSCSHRFYIDFPFPLLIVDDDKESFILTNSVDYLILDPENKDSYLFCPFWDLLSDGFMTCSSLEEVFNDLSKFYSSEELEEINQKVKNISKR